MNKLDLNVKYRYYNDERFGDKEELHPLSFLNSFNPNTILKIIEDLLHYVFVRGRRKEKFWSVYNGKYLGKQYFTTINIFRHNMDNSKFMQKWVMEVFVFDTYSKWKDGICKYANSYKGFVFWDITDLLNKVFEICDNWDVEVFGEGVTKCLKPHLNRHNIKSMDELWEKCRKCNDEIDRWESEYRKIEFDKNKEINELIRSSIKKFSDMTVPLYIKSHRVEFACELIKEGYLETYSMDAIAEKSGFSSQKKFNRVFKLIMSLTPTEYKKLYEK